MRFYLLLIVAVVGISSCATSGVDLDPGGPFTREELERRVAQLERRAERRPNDADTWYALGNAYFDGDAFNEARQAYRRVVELDESRADAWSNLGLTHRIQGNFMNAVSAYETALQLEPDDAVTLRNLSILMQDLGHLEASTGPLQRLLQLDPSDASIRNELAHVFVLVGRYDDALHIWEDGGDALPTEIHHDIARATALLRTGRLDEAGAVLVNAEARDSSHPMLPPARADYYRRMGEFEAAWREVDRCQRRGIPLDPDFVALLRAETDNRTGAIR